MTGEDAPQKTALHAWHKAHDGRLVEFGGWSMPVQYSTIVEEHTAVRRRAGLFDISHMGRLRFRGPDVLPWLEATTTNHVAKLVEGQIQYSLMVDESGGVLDDILVYRLADGFMVVCNASNRLKVVDQLDRNRDGFDAAVDDVTRSTAMIAVQGPAAAALVQSLVETPLDDLLYYRVKPARLLGTEAIASRTGYTGEDGFELIVPDGRAAEVWEALLEAGKAAGVVPCGLGARDTLRFEAAMPLYGHEMDETVNPYAAGLGWAVKLDKGEFLGREALRTFKAEPGKTRVGLQLGGKRIARQGHAVERGGMPAGVVTSGTFSPTLGRSLAMALVDPAAAAAGTEVSVDVRGHAEPAVVCPIPFYRRPVETAGPSVG